MSGNPVRGALAGALVVVAAALFAPAAQASVTPSISLDQSAGTQAAGTANLGMDLKFTDSMSDSPDAMTINLPPGLLANAAVNGGACLKTADLTDTNCQVGTGTVTADAIVDLTTLVALPVNVTFDLVPPPAPGDLAGLAVNLNGQQIGATAGIRVRPSGDPNGVGVSIDLVLPNSLDGAPIEITEINSTFDGLRYPASCPSTPAPVSVSVDSYQDSTVHTVSAPLKVTGCSSVPYAPKLTVKAVKDSSDRSVGITTAVTQAADESPSKSLALAFPDATLGVNLASVALICGNVVTDNCTPVGQATAASPLYPKPLTANAYLTGTALGPTLTLVFPAPFPLTLVGTVALTTKTASFTGLPDIPLTSLSLKLNGGPKSLFLTNCAPGNGVATGVSTDQNGDKTVSASVAYTISGCAASTSSNRGSGNGSANGKAHLTLRNAKLAKLRSGHPSLSFKATATRAKLTTLTAAAPRGLSFTGHKVGKRFEVGGLKLSGASAKSVTIAHGKLVVTFRKAVSSLGVSISGALKESHALAAAAAKAKKLQAMRLLVSAKDTRHARLTATTKIAHPTP